MGTHKRSPQSKIGRAGTGLALALGLGMTACAPSPEWPEAGRWEGHIRLHDSVELPLQLDLIYQGGALTQAVLNNHGEAIALTDIQVVGDSLLLNIPVFQSSFTLQRGATEMNGLWNYPDKGDDYRIPLRLRKSVNEKDMDSNQAATFLRYKATFSPGTQEQTPAVGEFTLRGSNLTGTFLTETGDYRYLGGTLAAGKMKLSTFDGAHAFVFDARQLADGSFAGTFYSGNHFSEPFVMEPNDTFQLRNPEALTTLKEGHEHISFTFPNAQGIPVSLADSSFSNKVVIVQIMGSWCPNCMDETRYLTSLYNDLHEQGLEIIGLAFERKRKPEDAYAAVQKMKTDLGAPYPFLVAGTSSKTEASEVLPMLSSITSFPTTLVIDRSGKVRKIHTGFSGPGTRSYAAFSASFRRFVVDLLREEPTQNPDKAGTFSE